MFDCLPKMPLLPVKKKKKLSYMILRNFTNCPVFINIKQTLDYKVAIE